MSEHPEPLLIKEIFGLALDVPAAELDHFLESKCQGDPALRAEIVELLQAHRQAGRFLDPGSDSVATLDEGSSTTIDEDNARLERFQWLLLDEQPGEIIDRYRLMEVIGEGGHGIVFRAEQQQPVQRVVALKVIRKGMESASARAGFDTERQTLALMAHPNIARLFDAGTTDQGRPYFVMELVTGVPITRYCDDHQLPIRRRVELFIIICRAIHHAHQKGIIHRDLKPANILVGQTDGLATPKVIDFGVSRLASPVDTSSDPRQILGTPQYMSPEQVSASEVVDTRSDIYSLGAVLYELLTGVMAVERSSRIQTPTDLRNLFKGPPPVAPSERAAVMASLPDQEKPRRIAANRATIPSQLAKCLKEDLDWITLKAINRDRSNRYDSAAALADDLQRHLDQRTVQAAPDNPSYVVRRFYARNKVAVLLTASVACLLMLSTLAVTMALFRVRAARDRAVIAEEAKAVSESEVIAKLRESYLLQAKARSRSRQQGQRIESLKTLALAAAMAPSPDFRMELRNEAITCLSLPDAELVERWDLPLRGSALILSKDLDQYAIVDSQYGIRIFKRSDRTLRTVLPEPPGGISRCNFSPDGMYFYDCKATPRQFHIWNLAERKLVFSLDYWPEFSFGNDSTCFALSTPSHLIEIHSGSQFQEVMSIGADSTALGDFRGIRFSPADDKIAVWGTLPGLALFAVHSPSAVQMIDTGKRRCMIAAWTPDGRDIAVGKDGAMENITIYRVQTGEPKLVMDEHSNTVVGLVFSHNGRFLISAGWDGQAKVWDAATGTEQLCLEPFGDNLQIGRDDTQISFQGNRDSQLWRLATCDEHRLLRGVVEEAQIVWTDTSPDGSLLAATTELGVRIWNLKTGKTCSVLSVPGPRSVFFGNDGKLLLVSTAVGIKPWNVADLNGREDPLEERVSEGSTSAIGGSRDGRTIVFQTPDGVLRIGSPDNLEQAVPLARDQMAHRFIAVSPDGMWAATSSRYDPPRAWNLNTRSCVRTFPLSQTANENGQVVFDTTGRFLVTSDYNAYRWYSVGDWKLIQTIQRQHGNVGHVAFSPDGKFVAVDGPGRSILLLDAATRKELATFTTSEYSGAAYLNFSRDSTLLIAGGPSHAVRLWDLPKIRRTLAAMNLDW